MATGVSRISEDRHYSGSAKANEGQTCAGDHGTHVGALVAGFENGAAKDAEIVSGASPCARPLCARPASVCDSAGPAAVHPPPVQMSGQNRKCEPAPCSRRAAGLRHGRPGVRA